jgi:hypothetical protein
VMGTVMSFETVSVAIALNCIHLLTAQHFFAE